MAIEDVIRDLNIYFDSIHKPVQFKAHMGGIVNPSYLMIKYEGKEQVLPFWATAGGSDKEKDLGKAFQDDITAFIERVDQCPEVEPEKAPAVEPERQRNGRRNKSNVSAAEFKPIQ